MAEELSRRLTRSSTRAVVSSQREDPSTIQVVHGGVSLGRGRRSSMGHNYDNEIFDSKGPVQEIEFFGRGNSVINRDSGGIRGSRQTRGRGRGLIPNKSSDHEVFENEESAYPTEVLDQRNVDNGSFNRIRGSSIAVVRGSGRMFQNTQDNNEEVLESHNEPLIQCRVNSNSTASKV